jgi:hypothetical protein
MLDSVAIAPDELVEQIKSETKKPIGFPVGFFVSFTGATGIDTSLGAHV